MSKKVLSEILRFKSVLLLIFEKGMSNKIAPGSLRSVCVLFNI